MEAYKQEFIEFMLASFKTSENAQKCSVFKGLRDFGESAEVSYFIGKWCSLRQKWCSKWCSGIGWRHQISGQKMSRNSCAFRDGGA